jgi:hypothetical protein
MPTARSLLAASAALAALAVPATAVAKPHAEQAHGHGRGHAKVKVHTVSMLLRGTYAGGALTVTGGNHAARRAGLVGQSVSLDLSSAKVKVRDTNGDGARDADDVRDGDKVVVQVRVARGDDAGDALTVRKLVDRAGSGADDQGEDSGSDDSADDTPAAPADDPADA